MAATTNTQRAGLPKRSPRLSQRKPSKRSKSVCLGFSITQAMDCTHGPEIRRLLSRIHNGRTSSHKPTGLPTLLLECPISSYHYHPPQSHLTHWSWLHTTHASCSFSLHITLPTKSSYSPLPPHRILHKLSHTNTQPPHPLSALTLRTPSYLDHAVTPQPSPLPSSSAQSLALLPAFPSGHSQNHTIHPSPSLGNRLSSPSGLLVAPMGPRARHFTAPTLAPRLPEGGLTTPAADPFLTARERPPLGLFGRHTGPGAPNYLPVGLPIRAPPAARRHASTLDPITTRTPDAASLLAHHLPPSPCASFPIRASPCGPPRGHTSVPRSPLAPPCSSPTPSTPASGPPRPLASLAGLRSAFA